MKYKSRKDLQNTIDLLTSENKELQKINREQAKRIDKLEGTLNDLARIHNCFEKENLRKCDNMLCILCAHCITEKTGSYTTIMGCKKDISCEDFTPVAGIKLNK